MAIVRGLQWVRSFEVVHPTSVAFIERLQSSLSLARKLSIAAQQRQKALADKRRVDRVYKVGDKVLLSTKYLNLKHREPSRKLLPNGLVHLKSCSVTIVLGSV
jgi:hypothetical protein